MLCVTAGLCIAAYQVYCFCLELDVLTSLKPLTPKCKGVKILDDLTIRTRNTRPYLVLYVCLQKATLVMPTGVHLTSTLVTMVLLPDRKSYCCSLRHHASYFS